ncbi:TonB-dependent receptor plug domain-containing protein [Thermaurantimonas aggregans]|uniref:TonB-dependent receptor plug domain-containing protein n=1 Tax=Thermaurantimonas aggregans TaxID=2173829 RepID=UPI0023F1B71A|nr:TonB-dependent receptor [Thermaurantimonas aggregans]MCX8149064.1 TonB-dependent receptor [Thermaurantimonas aggregans]
MKSSLSRFTLLLIVLPIWTAAQSACAHSLALLIQDAGSKRPLKDAFVTISDGRNLSRSSLTSKEGRAEFRLLCNGQYHYTILHAGCQPVMGSLQLKGDTILIVGLQHSVIELPEVSITEKKIAPGSASQKHLSAAQIERLQFKPLADVVTSIPGVSVLRTGGQIAKPIIRGMNAQRIAVLNHGMPQAGQQWGNDHAPEVSTLVYDSIAVIRGIAAVELPAGQMGGAMLADKKASFIDQHLHGRLQSGIFTNGRGAWGHLKLEKGNTNAGGIRADVAYKTAGDLHTPDYYLRNTGVHEFSYGLLWRKNISSRIDNIFNYNYYRTTLGILRGAHIGNVSDLQEALSRPIPFFTEDQFSSRIDLPRQEVTHHTINNLTNVFISPQSSLRIRVGFQHNDRKEFDFRRSGENDRPALSLIQNDFYTEISYRSDLQKTGVQFRVTDNTNNPETGILPLIPDFLSYRVAIFHSGIKRILNQEYTYGLRYELIRLQAFPIERSVPLVVREEFRTFQTYTVNLATNIFRDARKAITYEGQLTLRAPDVNELYSFGLHQGVAGIEEGNRTLRNEFGIQQHVNTLYHKGSLTIQADAYAYLFRNFINLEPTGELRSTIRGAFPIFKYNQHDLALLTGLDVNAEIGPFEPFTLEAKGSFLYAQNLSTSQPLAWMPANRAQTSLIIAFPELNKIKNIDWRITGLFVARQRRVLPEQDFMPPPAGYTLLNSSISFTLPAQKSLFRFSIGVENLLNQKCRDYLNRWKYFADEMGRNLVFSVAWNF